jgi:hypothetical protein
VFVNQGHLSKEITLLQVCKEYLFTISILADLNSSGLDDIHGVTLITLAEDDFSFIATDAEKVFALTHSDKYNTLKITNCLQIPGNKK